MTDTLDTLLAAYDTQLRRAPSSLPAGIAWEQDGPLLRARHDVLCGRKQLPSRRVVWAWRRSVRILGLWWR